MIELKVGQIWKFENDFTIQIEVLKPYEEYGVVGYVVSKTAPLSPERHWRAALNEFDIGVGGQGWKLIGGHCIFCQQYCPSSLFPQFTCSMCLYEGDMFFNKMASNVAEESNLNANFWINSIKKEVW